MIKDILVLGNLDINIIILKIRLMKVNSVNLIVLTRTTFSNNYKQYA